MPQRRRGARSTLSALSSSACAPGAALHPRPIRTRSEAPRRARPLHACPSRFASPLFDLCVSTPRTRRSRGRPPPGSSSSRSTPTSPTARAGGLNRRSSCVLSGGDLLSATAFADRPSLPSRPPHVRFPSPRHAMALHALPATAARDPRPVHARLLHGREPLEGAVETYASARWPRSAPFPLWPPPAPARELAALSLLTISLTLSLSLLLGPPPRPAPRRRSRASPCTT